MRIRATLPSKGSTRAVTTSLSVTGKRHRPWYLSGTVSITSIDDAEEDRRPMPFERREPPFSAMPDLTSLTRLLVLDMQLPARDSPGEEREDLDFLKSTPSTCALSSFSMRCCQ